MTANTPSPYQPAAASPTVNRGVLGLGDILSGTFGTLKTGLGLFVRLTLAPIAFMVASVVVFIVLVFVAVAPAVMIAGEPQAPAPGQVGVIVALFLALFVAMVATYVLYYVCLGRMSVAALDLAEGRGVPTWDNLRQRTPGLGRRVATLVVLVALVTLLANVLLLLAFVPLVLWSATGQSAPSPEMGGVVAVLLLLAPALVLVALFVTVKLVYTIVVMAEEGHSAFGSLRRSWAITRGAFFRTLGYWIVGSLVASLIGAAAQLVTVPLLPGSQSANELSPMALVYVVLTVVITGAVALLLVPFQAIWVTLMYLGRRRELAGEAVVSPWPGDPQPHQGTYPPSGTWQPGSPPQR